MDYIITAIALTFSIILHEVSHGYVAYLHGDDTAKRMGRLSLNPLKHLDLFGFISLFLFGFGWAKPVPINPNRFENPKAGMISVSLAGVTANLCSAFLAIWLTKYVPSNWNFLIQLLFRIAIYGVSLCIFNLVPIPPLDGSKVVMTFLPERARQWIESKERLFYVILVILVFSRALSMVISPIIDRVFQGIILLVYS